jgi:hypothetical protein
MRCGCAAPTAEQRRPIGGEEQALQHVLEPVGDPLDIEPAFGKGARILPESRAQQRIGGEVENPIGE